MAMKKNKKELGKLLCHVQTVANIQCSSCGKKVGDWDEDSLAEKAFESGWTATKLNCYCSKCSKNLITVRLAKNKMAK